MSLIILQQILIMGLYMLIGYLLYKTGKVTNEGSRSLANLLAWIVIPSTILNSFLVEFTAARLLQFAVSLLAGTITVLIALVISALFFRGSQIEQFAAAFSNCGFIGIPLIRATIGEDGVFFLVGLLIAFNVIQWTYGIQLLLGSRKGEDGREIPVPPLTAKRVLLNPIVLAAIIGFFLFVSGLGGRLPRVLTGCVEGIAGINAPLAMIVLGVYLAQSSFLALFTDKRLYLVSGVRLLVIPAFTILAMWLLPVDSSIKMTMIIAGSAPVGVNVAVYSQIFDTDYIYACKTVTQSTLFSILTMPFIILLAELLIHTA